MPSPFRAFGHAFIALALTTCVVVVPLRGADERAAALPMASSAMHDALCHSSSSETMDPAMHGGMLMPTAASCTAFRPALSMTAWSITASSSAKGHSASAALRGGSRTWWQSKTPSSGGFRAQTLTLKARSAKTATGLRYQPANGRGAIGRFEVRLSKDGRRFGAVVATGRWERGSTTKEVGWTPTKIRAVRITISSVSPESSKSVTAATVSLTGVQPSAVASAPTPENSHKPTPEPPQASAPASTPENSHGPTPEASQAPAPASTPTDSSSAPTIEPAPSTLPSPGTTSPAVLASNPAVVGRWGPTIAFPLVPVAVAAIPGNRLVVWAADEDMSFDSSNASAVTQTAILDLTTGAVSATRVSNPGHDMFCPGISLLADGRILVTGGISNAETSVYDPTTDRWTVGPRMNIGRGYQGQTTLSGGGAFVIGGSFSGALGGKAGEIYSSSGGWRVLPGVTSEQMLTADSEGVFRSDNHAWLVASSSGTVLQAGPSKQMHWISTAGDGAVLTAGFRGESGDQMNGNAVLFDVDKMLTVGGASSYQNVDATGAANVLDLSGGYGHPVAVSTTGSLAHPRSYANGVVLPDGSVMTIGGMAHPVVFSDAGSVLTPELWNEASGTWRQMADAAEPRNYHSVATLLPDGTIFSGGGGLCGVGCATNHPTGQIFSPPYLFNSDGSTAIRPTVTDVPADADPGQVITVGASSEATGFVLIRASAATHSLDNDQRRVPLAVRARTGSTATLAIPADNGIVLPGRYMLFAMTAGGVPSISAPITIGVKG